LIIRRKQTERGYLMRVHGFVKWFNSAKGYGFITSDDRRDIFVHYSFIQEPGRTTLNEGERVTFEIEERPKGPWATNILLEIQSTGQVNPNSRKEKNYYQILQVDQDAEPEIIVAAYKRLALKYHPDVNGSPNAKQIMQELNLAYSVISDPNKRVAYDVSVLRKK
jgi:cold shock protein